MVVVLLLLFGWGPNFLLLVLSLIVLVVGALICWRPGEPAIILYLFGNQWLQASIAIFVANWQGKPIAELAVLSSANMAGASALTLVGLLVIFICFRLAAGPTIPELVSLARQQAMHLTPRSMYVAYTFGTVITMALTYLSGFSEGIRQPLLAFASFKWALFFIVAFAGLLRPGPMRQLFFVVFSIELILSLGGYFSAFQTVFVYTFIAMVAANVRLNVMRIATIISLVVVALAVGIVWSAIKVEYRAYLNAGSGQQVILVGWYDRIGKLISLATSINGQKFAEGTDQLLRRLTYVEFFGATMNYVPATTPHTLGALWGSAVIHPVTPRFLFPSKPITDDSSLTRQYTGIQVAGWEQGTQISIGYFGESYIDFGITIMMLPLALYGLAMGAAYRIIMQLRQFCGLVSFALLPPLLIIGANIGQSTVKLVGGFVVTTIAIFCLHLFLARWVRRLVIGPKSLSR